MCDLPRPRHRPWKPKEYADGADLFLCFDRSTDKWMPADLGDIKRKHPKGVVPVGDPANSRKPVLTAYKQGQARRAEFLKHVTEHHSIQDAVAHLGIHMNTYTRWRQKYPDFAARVDLARGIRVADRMDYTGSFADFRRNYLGMSTTWFQQRAVTALEECKEGEIILMLWHPESGKTTTVCDFINMKLALDPTCRITVVSENRNHAMKMLRRVRNRMEPDGPTPLYVRTFGPFVPDEATGKRGAAQPWAADHFDVRQREHYDEQDYSCSAAGITTAIQGTRADWLIIDDVQSLKSLNQTDAYVDKMRQDFFSRSGMFGRICILGTRVGNDDVYRRLLDEELVDTLIKFPAQDNDGNWLWPERYTEEQYLKIRKRVGESAWWRNYMQEPASAKDSAFTKEIVEPCFNEARSVIADAPQERDAYGNLQVLPVVVGVDPALGSINSITACGLGAKKLYYLSSRADTGFTRNEEIFAAIEEMVIRWNQPGVSKVVEVVIEAMNFQQGLVDDDRMRELVKRYGFRVVPSLVGVNKYDPNIGVTSMPLSFMRHEIDLPFADRASEAEVRIFAAELYAWREGKRGNRLRQDRVMSFWYCWRRFKAKRAFVGVDPTQFSSKPSPLRRSA